MLSRLVRDILRADRPDVGASAKKFALRHCGHRVGAKKFAQHTKNGPKWVFYGALGEFFRGNAPGGAALGEFVAPCAWQSGPFADSVNPSMRS